MSVINTNYLSLVAQNNLTKSQSSLNTAIERLSSGMRINSAKDDAAGQAIANRFTSNVKGLTQAARNANDGISIAQTTEGSLDEINNNLQRIRELTVQASTGTNSPDDLASIQDEIGERLSEIDRISQQTDFNGVKVLAKDQALTIQVGAHDHEVINIGLQKIDKTSLGLGDLDVQNIAQAVDASEFEGTSFEFELDNETVEGTLLKVAGEDEGDATYYVRTDDGALYGVDGDPTESDGVVTVSLEELDNDAELPINLMPLDNIDEAIAQVDDLRSHLGAIQNRFESTITNLNNTVNNLSAARSRIEDADYAVEVSNMTRAQILQQAGTSVLAQANQVPQTVLSLLS